MQDIIINSSIVVVVYISTIVAGTGAVNVHVIIIVNIINIISVVGKCSDP